MAAVRPPGPRVVSGVQHFAAGVVNAALVGEIMPELRDEGHVLWTIVGFVAGAVLVRALGEYGRHSEEAAAVAAAAHPKGSLRRQAVPPAWRRPCRSACSGRSRSICSSMACSSGSGPPRLDSRHHPDHRPNPGDPLPRPLGRLRVDRGGGQQTAGCAHLYRTGADHRDRRHRRCTLPRFGEQHSDERSACLRRGRTALSRGRGTAGRSL
ncbi:hypothetical protein BN11_850006 [Nostocoides australiense Ben110]|uniref:Uncharacterized protein n=1 Tax=Nostocoides australiense Ben110 TaxID=1193182 RepID=W6K142_9MICO|nr:hypothetical protein BN11_850006 [Tetrasphaera australiensis Ben110]